MDIGSTKPGLKRRRKDSAAEEGTSSAEAPTRLEPWFDDGNIILETEAMQFRVHRGVLAASSNIFADMFSVPQPVQGDEVVDGCPVVKMLDNAEELKHVLKAIYDRSYCSDLPTGKPLAVIAAFLRLGRKYEIATLRQEAIRALTIDYPRNLHAFLNQGDRPAVDGHICDIISLAREQDVLSILPAAFYYCVGNASLAQILRGWQGHNSLLKQLSIEDQHTCVLGESMLIDYQCNQLFGWLHDGSGPNQDCDKWENCQAAIQDTIRELWTPEPFLRAFDPWEYDRHFCARCDEDFHARWEQAQRLLWERLPVIFSLPPWHELHGE